MKNVQYVIGTQFGDEGKGKTVQYLCKKAISEGKRPLVVRYCSGPQASHTVFYNGVTHVCSSFGSGVLLGIPTLIIDDTSTFVDPIALRAEYDVLKAKGLDPKFYVTDYCYVITPYDIIANRRNDDSLRNGTCGKGVWETMARNDINFIGGPYLNNLEQLNRHSLEIAAKFYGITRSQQLEDKFIEDLRFVESQPKINPKDYDVIIMESSQGLLLDGKYGLKPYITPAQIVPKVNNYTGRILSPFVTTDSDVEIFLCTRTYTTRHGAGYEPIPSEYIKYPNYETNKDNSLQGTFKTGMLDIDLINRGIDRCCLDNIEGVKFNLVINHMDCLDENYFEYILGNRCFTESSKDAASLIEESIRLNFEHVYLGYSPTSNFTVK